MKNILNYKKGISLVETLIAVTIMSLLILSVVSLLANLSKSEKHNKVLAEVEYQASAIIYEIAQSVRNASAITSPGIGATSSELILALPSLPNQDPTSFSTSAHLVLANKGGGGINPVSSTMVEVTNLTFQNISAPGTKGAIRIFLSLQATNPNNKPELTYATTRITTVTLR